MKANVLGYSLNQRGLFGNIVRDPRDCRVKKNAGEPTLSATRIFFLIIKLQAF